MMESNIGSGFNFQICGEGVIQGAIEKGFHGGELNILIIIVFLHHLKIK
jgi:hypothetical protein